MYGKSANFSGRLLKWYDANRRQLPWRLAPGAEKHAAIDPYHALVSEAMLQQTQVATVVPYFERFVARYPTVQSLAESELQDVLRLWQGLGYYSRAKNLRAAAGKIVSEFGGVIPATVEELLTLPGIGRYTAGAIASIAFNNRAPILDGNVARVVCRLDCIKEDPREPSVRGVLWKRAEEILPRKRIGDFNSALMELGALICVPKSPQCLICPVRAHCEGAAAGLQDRIPPARKKKPTPLHRRRVFCIRHREQFLIEQRPARGRWAGMWQFVTIEHSADELSSEYVGTTLSLPITRLRSIGQIEHALTHRRYEFEIFSCETARKNASGVENRKWVKLSELGNYPLPGPHVKVAELLANQSTK